MKIMIVSFDMLTYLLALVLNLNKVNNPWPAYFLPPDKQEALVSSFFHDYYILPIAKERKLPPLRVSNFFRPDINFSSQSVIVIDDGSGEVLFKKDISSQLPIASLTKLMTAVIFLESKTPFSKEIEIIGEDNSNVPGSRLYISQGEKLTVKDLFYSSLVGSANNATKALARSTGMPAGEFISKMNAKAKFLGMGSTEYYDVTGLDPRNISTVEDYARLATYAFQNPNIKKAVQTPEYIFETLDGKIIHHIRNTDQLLNNNSFNIFGAKTGYLNEAGFTFACLAEKGGHKVIIVLFKASSSQARFDEAKSLANWAFSNYGWLVDF